MKPWACAVSLAVVSLAVRIGHAETPPRSAPSAESITLANGLRVLLAPDPSARLVSVNVEYAAGSADDPDGLHGLAHVTEHLTFVRTTHASGLLGQLFASGASYINGTTTPDATTYYETMSPERLDVALWLESERMGYVGAAVTDAAVDAQRAVVGNELRQLHSDQGYAVASTAALYPAWHPYAYENADDTDLDRIRAVDVRAFLRTWYVPANATLAIAGRFDRDAAVATVSRYFGAIPNTTPPLRPTLPDSTPAPTAIAVSTYTDASSVVLAWRTPAMGTTDDLALDLVAEALAGPDNELLGPMLVDAHLATSVSAHQLSKREGSMFVVSATLLPGSSEARVLAAMESALAKLSRRAFPTEDRRVHRRLREELAGARETTWGRAAVLQSLAARGALPKPGFDWGAHLYDAVDAAAIARAAQQWLGAEHRVTTVVVADPKAWRTTVRVDGVEQNHL